MSRDCCLALPHDIMGCPQFVIVVFPDHTHYFFLLFFRSNHLHVYKCMFSSSIVEFF